MAAGRSRGRRISRFTVMAILQAARARALGLSEDSAFSWGLNRAIFYAAAKRGFGGRSGGGGEGHEKGAAKEGERAEPGREMYSVGEEEAYRDTTSDKLYFTIGDETQTEADFRRQVASRFGTDEHFREAWREAQEIVAGFDEETLRSQRGFFDRVYKPRRDELAEQWTDRFLPTPPPRS
jgi:hypothetical protein